MTALATPSDLQSFLALDQEIDSARAMLILDAVSSEIRKFSGDPFTLSVADEIVLDGSGTELLMLPSVPVTEVTEVKEAGVALDASSWVWSAKGMLRRVDGLCWAQQFRWYTVTYDHGLAEVPAEIKMLALRVAARGWANPTGLTQEGEGGYTAAYGFDATRFAQLTDADRDILRDYMGR